MASNSTGSSESSAKSFLKYLSDIHPALQTSVETIYKSATKLVKKYEKMVIEDPETTAKLESTLNYVSFLLPGQFKSSELLSELVYSATKMLSLLHDIIYRKKAAMLHDFLWNKQRYLEATLTTLEYLEAFIELGAGRLWGEPGKWLVVFILQIFKAFLKVLLLYFFDSGIQTSPPLTFIREKYLVDNKTGPKELHKESSYIPEEEKPAKTDEGLDEAWEEASAEPSVSGPSAKVQTGVWAGKRSGRMIRSLKNAPPKGFRDWRVPKIDNPKDEDVGIDYYKLKSKLSHADKTAELAYILRPVAHLSSMFVCGEKSWKPWILSLLIEVSSIHFLQSKKHLYKLEKDELMKRKAKLLMYLLRSPFYDSHSKTKLETFLRFLGEKIPVVGMVANPLLQYLPIWQGIYSHTWSN